jgi:hypothetical protein
MAEIDLVFDGVVLAKYQKDQQSPPSVRGLQIKQEPKSRALTLSWEAAPVSKGKVTFTVQVSNDGKQWETIAIGLTESTVTLSQTQAKARMVRVITSNGFRSSSPVMTHLQPTKPAPRPSPGAR